MKYVIIGAGGTGGCIAAYMHRAQKDVTLIARGKHLEEIQKNGLTINEPNDTVNIKLCAVAEENYDEKADVIFVCVKYYSIEETYDFIKKSSHEKTIVIPILNVFGTGEKMAESLNGIEVLNGCIYIASSIESPSVLKKNSDVFRIVYGRLDGNTEDTRLQTIKQDLEDSGISVVLSNNIKRDTMRKFTLISSMASVGAYFDANASTFKKDGKERKMAVACIKEVVSLANAMGIDFEDDMLEVNLNIINNMSDDTTTSMQKDLKKGGNSELDGLVIEVVRLAECYGVDVPTYKMIVEKLA